MLSFQIHTINSKTLIGLHQVISIGNNTTSKLWNAFRKEQTLINNIKGNELYSIHIYPPNYFETFNPDLSFENWAAIEVENTENIPEGFEVLHLEGGLYAAFDFKGNHHEGAQAFDYIHREWLPKSDYQLDNRPHFEIIGDKYKIDGQNSEETMWIPIKLKTAF